MKWKHALWLLFAVGMVPGIFAQLCPPVIKSQHAFPDFGFSSIKPLQGGGYILVGGSYPRTDPNQTSANYGLSDGYLIRLNGNLERVWDQTFGGTDWDGLSFVEELPDGFILAGTSSSARAEIKRALISENRISGSFARIAMGKSFGNAITEARMLKLSFACGELGMEDLSSGGHRSPESAETRPLLISGTSTTG